MPKFLFVPRLLGVRRHHFRPLKICSCVRCATHFANNHVLLHRLPDGSVISLTNSDVMLSAVPGGPA